MSFIEFFDFLELLYGFVEHFFHGKHVLLIREGVLEIDVFRLTRKILTSVQHHAFQQLFFELKELLVIFETFTERCGPEEFSSVARNGEVSNLPHFQEKVDVGRYRTLAGLCPLQNFIESDSGTATIDNQHP